MIISNADVYVTGSNSHFLSTDVVTEFRGRGDEIHLFPLSFSEYCEGYKGTIDNAWKDYYTYGGLPLILKLDTDKKKEDYLNNLYKSVYLVDVLERHKIKNMGEFDELRTRGYHVDVGMVEVREPDKSGKLFRKQLEVDFVVNQGSQRYYIQSAFAMPTLEKEAQESASLLRIKDSFKKIIIVKDDIKPKRNEDGILTIGLKDFLLDKNSLNY